MQRPDLRDLTANIADALGELDRESLLAILTFVFKEYVVDGPPPMLMHQAETIAELQGLSFAQLVSTLQTRLDVPELALFQVEGERVSVRVGGTLQPLQPPRSMPPLEAPRSNAEQQAGVRVIEATLVNQPRRPSSPADEALARGRSEIAGGVVPVAAPSPAPRPPGGVSLRQPGESRLQPAPASPGAAAAPQPAPAPASQGPGEKVTDGDDASARFSLLELD